MQKAFSFDIETIKKMGKSALIAGAGAALTYAFQSLGEMDFGQWTPLVAALCAWGVNAVREWVRGA